MYKRQVHISIELLDPEKITIKATIKPPNAPSKISGALSGIEKAVTSAVVAVIRRRSPVFSATPSIVIMLDSYPSHQGASLYADLSNVESLSAGFPDRYIDSGSSRGSQGLGLVLSDHAV